MPLPSQPKKHHRPLNGIKLYCLVTRARVRKQLAQDSYKFIYRIYLLYPSNPSSVNQSKCRKVMDPGSGSDGSPAGNLLFANPMP